MLVCLSVHPLHYWYIATTLGWSLGSVMNAISSNRTEQLQLNTMRTAVKAEAGVQELLSQTLCDLGPSPHPSMHQFPAVKRRHHTFITPSIA